MQIYSRLLSAVLLTAVLCACPPADNSDSGPDDPTPGDAGSVSVDAGERPDAAAADDDAGATSDAGMVTVDAGERTDAAAADDDAGATSDAGMINVDAGERPDAAAADDDAGAPEDAGASGQDAGLAALRAEALARVQSALQASTFDDATLVLGDTSGVVTTLTKGALTPDTIVPTYSAQKWVVATVLLRELQARDISLDDPLSSYPAPLDFATVDDPRGGVDARGLLSFTSGFETNATCASVTFGVLANCVDTIAAGTFDATGKFNYGTYHMTLLSYALAHENGETYADQFERFRIQTGLFAGASYTSAQKPVGFQTNATEYAAFLQAHLSQTLLSPSHRTEMYANQSLDAVVLASVSDDIDGNWEYGFGNWQRCDDGQPCRSDRNSGGARGFFPWLDLEDESFGVLAAEGALGDYVESAALFEIIREDALLLSHAP